MYSMSPYPVDSNRRTRLIKMVSMSVVRYYAKQTNKKEKITEMRKAYKCENCEYAEYLFIGDDINCCPGCGGILKPFNDTGENRNDTGEKQND